MAPQLNTPMYHLPELQGRLEGDPSVCAPPLLNTLRYHFVQFNSVNCRKRITQDKPGSTREKQKQKGFTGQAGQADDAVWFFVVSPRIQASELLRENNPSGGKGQWSG